MQKDRHEQRLLGKVETNKHVRIVRYRTVRYSVFAYMCVYVPQVCRACRCQRRASDPLESQALAGCHVGAGNQDQVLYNTSKCP